MKRGQQYALVGGLCAWLALAAGMVLDPAEFFRSYLFAFLFCLGLSLGALANLMLHAVTGGGWGRPLRVPLAAAARLMPLNALLFLPLLLGLPFIYRWMNSSEELTANAWWLNQPFFLARAAIYLLAWIALSWRWLAIAQHSKEERPAALRRLSAGGLIVYGLTISLAAIDWIMSLMPQWYSTAFGLVVGVAQMLAGMALGAAACSLLPRLKADASALHDYGNLLLMYVMSWAYVAFTQFLIIWAEDLPHEIAWYLPRTQTSWRWLTLAIVVLQFGLPFLLLLSRAAKRTARYLGPLAIGLLFAQLLYTFYLVTPTLEPRGFAISWSDPLAVLAVCGLWFAAWLRNLARAGVPR